MRIDGSGRPIELRGPAAARPSTSQGRFTLASGTAAGEAGATRASTGVAGLDAVLALQAVDDPLQGRRRAVRRGRRTLDALDELRVAVLEGAVPADQAARLASLVGRDAEAIDDPELGGVLAEIDLRAAVELAKLERQAGKAGGHKS